MSGVAAPPRSSARSAPRRRLPRPLPRIVSAATVPTTLSIPRAFVKASVKPARTTWGAVSSRSIVIPPPVSWEKSSVSMPALAASSSTSVPETPPTKNTRSSPKPLATRPTRFWPPITARSFPSPRLTDRVTPLPWSSLPEASLTNTSSPPPAAKTIVTPLPSLTRTFASEPPVTSIRPTRSPSLRTAPNAAPATRTRPTPLPELVSELNRPPRTSIRVPGPAPELARSENWSLTSVISVASARFWIDPKLIPARLIFVPVPLLISVSNLIPPRLIVAFFVIRVLNLAPPVTIETRLPSLMIWPISAAGRTIVAPLTVDSTASKSAPPRWIFVPVPLLISALNLIPPRLIVPVCLMSDLKFAPPMLIDTPSAVFTSVWKATAPKEIGAVCSTRDPRSAPPRLIFVPVPLLIRVSNLMPPRLIVAVCLTSDLKFALPMSRVAAAA